MYVTVSFFLPLNPCSMPTTLEEDRCIDALLEVCEHVQSVDQLDTCVKRAFTDKLVSSDCANFAYEPAKDMKFPK